jgi:hypothetical protein
MTLYIYKTELIPSSQRSSQVTSRALQEITSSPQHINQNVLDVVSASEAVASSSAPVQVPKLADHRSQELNHLRLMKLNSLQHNHQTQLKDIISENERTIKNIEQ